MRLNVNMEYCNYHNKNTAVHRKESASKVHIITVLI